MSNWYDGTKNQKIAVSTRIRLARNLRDMSFPSKMTDSDFSELKNRVKNVIKNSNTPFSENLKYIDMANVPENEIGAMVERHIISPEFAQNAKNKAIILSDDESISIMIGEEDHIRIQVILPGLQLENAYDIAERLDTLLYDNLHFAFDNTLGYLTECPTNLGTGLRASVMLHLPLLETSGELSSLADTIGKIGFTIRGLYGEGSVSKAGLYQISNQITLGLSEKNAIDNLKLITNQIIEKEEKNREKIDNVRLEDNVFRALGTLKNARILSGKEAMNLLSSVKLGLDMGIIKEDINPIKVVSLIGPYSIMSKHGEMNALERDIARANIVREIFN